MKKYPFAIISSNIGERSETFIHRHMLDLYPGGTVAVVSRKGAAYDKTTNWPPHIILNESGRITHALGLAARRLGLTRATYRQYLGRKFLFQHGVDTVMAEFLILALDWLPILKSEGYKFYAHAHGYDVSEGLLSDAKIREAYLRFNQADGIITMSEFSRQKLIEIGIEKNKIDVVPYGVSVPNDRILRAQSQGLRCVAVGRMVLKKAPLSTLEALRLAADDVPELHLDFIGDGPLLPALKDYVRAHRLESHVTLHGERDNEFVQQLMRQSDLFLQHSVIDPETGDQEGLPVAILEAMANGLPVISTRHAGIPEAVEHGCNGYLVAEGDTAGMAEAIVRIAQDRTILQEFGQNSWARAGQYFSHQREISRLREILEPG